MLSSTPAPPYYAVIFTSIRTDENSGYVETAEQLAELATSVPGFLGIDSARSDVGITVSYWRDLDAIETWRLNAEHQQAQEKGRRDWYRNYKVRIAKVERDYEL